MRDQQEIRGHGESCGNFSGMRRGKRVDLHSWLGQEIRGKLVQHKQRRCTVECHFWSDRDGRVGNIVRPECGENRKESLGARRIAGEEGSLVGTRGKK